ncbi:phage holin family protein [Algoriphagus halophilus]|uniref:phage holin family protein n=1 Tax=Algoriphagus halophilus TaxID=226505 RepID=UPI00358FAD61
MPSKLFASIGLSQKSAFGIHMAMYGTPLLYLFEKYVFDDWDFLVSLILLFFMDTVVGSIASIVEGKFKPSQGAKMFGMKLIGYTFTVICIGIMDNTLIAGRANWLEGIVDAGAYAVLMAFEGASVLKNIYRIYPFEPIKLILAKLEIYYNRQKNKVDPEL